MTRVCAWGLVAVALAAQTPPVLIVADEFPAMEMLAAKLKAAGGVESALAKQGDIKGDLAGRRAVIVYIHGDITARAERQFIQYAEGGGRLVLLHHSISSGKRRNQYWTPFTGVTLPWGEFEKGGYRWIDPVTMEIVNLAPQHPITTRGVEYETKVRYRGAERQGFTLKDTEVYLNHVFTEPRTHLLGLRYTDPASGKSYEQDSAGWVKRAGRGWVVYFMPGHSVAEFEHPAYSRIVVNAVTGPLE